MKIINPSFEAIRAMFPSLSRELDGMPISYLDGPAGTQVPQQVIDVISEYYKTSNSNTNGFFQSTMETDEIIQKARSITASFLGAEGPETISFGQNMTTLAYSLSRGIGRTLSPGDEVLITQLDHEANRGPWLTLKEFGAKVIEINITPQGTLDMEDFQSKMNQNTKLVAIGCASNLLGTVNDFEIARELCTEYGAKLILDAVHYAPHFPINVVEMGCDFLFCSAYKFYGPHVGILYSKPGELDALPTDSLRTQYQKVPYKIETGTLNHAALAGVSACIKFIASTFGSEEITSVHASMEALSKHEYLLLEQLYNGIREISKATIYGPGLDSPRTPTVSFTYEGLNPEEVCTILGKKGIYAWDGHFYAIRPIEVLGLLDRGGVTRLGISIYTTPEDIERAVEAIGRI